jgi:hypothetical protein
VTSPNTRVADLMDYRFVALKATDRQEAAIALFKSEDRKAFAGDRFGGGPHRYRDHR